MSEPINKDHDHEYWRREYENVRQHREELRNALQFIIAVAKDEDISLDDALHDIEVEAYRALYEHG